MSGAWGYDDDLAGIYVQVYAYQAYARLCCFGSQKPFNLRFVLSASIVQIYTFKSTKLLNKRI